MKKWCEVGLSSKAGKAMYARLNVWGTSVLLVGGKKLDGFFGVEEQASLSKRNIKRIKAHKRSNHTHAKEDK